MPIGILGSLGICTLLYIAVSAVITGMEPYPDMDRGAARRGLPLGRETGVRDRDLGGGTARPHDRHDDPDAGYKVRVFFAMSRDSFAAGFSKVNERFGTPVRTTILTGVVVAVISALVPLSDLAELVNIGTLFAFILVAIGVIVLRRTRPDLPAGLPMPRRPGHSPSWPCWRRST